MTRDEIQDRVESAFDELANALSAGKSDTLIRYLEMCSRFHNYSFGNCVLIWLQRPDATFVAGFHRWRELGRHVLKGEHGIAILAPVTRRGVVEKERADGTTESIETRRLLGFRTVFVYDVSQTEGDLLPEFATAMGDPGDMTRHLETLVRKWGISLRYEVVSGGALGSSAGGTIIVRPDLSPAETFRVLVHETAHEKLHQNERRQSTTKTVRETEAEAVAFIVGKTFGIDSTTRSSDYIQLYTGDKAALLDSLDEIQRTATAIISELNALRKEATHALAS